MRRLLFALVLLLAALPGRAQLQAFTIGVRGVWLTNVDSDVLQTRAKIAEAMDYLASRGFNTVFPVVYNGGYTLHPSGVMTRTFGESARVHPSFAGRDVLAELVFEGHRAGLEVIPWFEYGFAASFEGNGGHILSKKPEWAARCAPGSGTNCDAGRVKKNGFFWLDALNPEVQAYMTDLVLEVARNYDIDGIQGDDRLPAMAVEGGYTRVDSLLYAQDHAGARPPAFARDAGFVQWKARRLTRYLGTLYRAVKAVDQHLLVSMSPSPYTFGYDEYLQDSPRWLDSSYVDLFHPQLYRYDINQYRFEADKALGFLNRTRDLAKLSPGIIIKTGSRFAHPDTVVQAVRFNRERGITGEVFFFYEGLRGRNPKGQIGDSLRKHVYRLPALVPGRNGLRRPPARILHETDAGVLTGTWEEACVIPNQPASCPRDGANGSTLRKAGPAGTAYYRLPVAAAATYNVWAWVPYRSLNRPNATTGASYTFGPEQGPVRAVIVNQNETNSGGGAGGRWVRLGDATTRSGEAIAVTLNSGTGDGGDVYADAVLALLDRKQSPDAVVPVAAEEAPVTGSSSLAVHVSPNPAREAVRVYVETNESAAVEVLDLLGRRRAAAQVKWGMPLTLSTAELPAGVYVVRATTGAQTGVARLVVAR